MAPPSPFKAAAFLLLALLLPLPPSLSDNDPAALLARHAAQLDRLESLLSALSSSVSALESSLSAPRPRSTADLSSPSAAPCVAVRKHKPLWSERFQFAASAQLESSAASAAFLPYKDHDGLTKYFAVGDVLGRVFVFSAAGDVVLSLPAVSDAPVAVILAYLSSLKNESLLFTGHADGSIAAHRLWESVAPGDDWPSLALGSSRPFVRGGGDSPPVTGLEIHQVGRTRYVIASDGGGRIRIFTESGTLYGTAIASSRPLAFMRQRLLFLTESGAGSLDLRSMAVKETECEGLNGSVIKSYSFDRLERTKAYGFTAEGDLFHVVLLGNVGNLKCRVRSIRKSEIDSPVSIQTIKGYLLVAGRDKVSVYNISSQYYGRVGAPRTLFSATIQEIRSQISSEAPMDEFSEGAPLIAVDRERLVVLGLGGGCIGIFRSNLPVYKLETNHVVWSAPALLFLLFLIGIWQFYVKKKDALGWTPEEAFSVPSAAEDTLSVPPAGERAYGDASRVSDLRASGIRGPLRRYTSPPPRYSAGHNSHFTRPTSAEPGFRATADLKYRGKSTETAGLPNRREPLFSNTQFVEEHVD